MTLIYRNKINRCNNSNYRKQKKIKRIMMNQIKKMKKRMMNKGMNRKKMIMNRGMIRKKYSHNKSKLKMIRTNIYNQQLKRKKLFNKFSIF